MTPAEKDALRSFMAQYDTNNDTARLHGALIEHGIGYGTLDIKIGDDRPEGITAFGIAAIAETLSDAILKWRRYAYRALADAT